MDKTLYEMIFKRKSFHLFRNIDKISEEEINKISEKIKTLKPLIEDIKIKIKIVKAETTTCTRGEEYCILFYSEKKENYLQNIGYIGEQLDLYLPSLNIGTLWFGIGKVNEPKEDGLDFVIMIAMSKVDEKSFRKDMYKSKRKTLDEIWQGKNYLDIGDIVRFSPSACNTQPWLVESNERELTVFRYKKPGKRGIMPIAKVNFYNKIDIGIFLCILEVCLEHSNIAFSKELFADMSLEEREKTLVAKYQILK